MQSIPELHDTILCSNPEWESSSLSIHCIVCCRERQPQHFLTIFEHCPFHNSLRPQISLPCNHGVRERTVRIVRVCEFANAEFTIARVLERYAGVRERTVSSRTQFAVFVNAKFANAPISQSTTSRVCERCCSRTHRSQSIYEFANTEFANDTLSSRTHVRRVRVRARRANAVVRERTVRRYELRTRRVRVREPRVCERCDHREYSSSRTHRVCERCCSPFACAEYIRVWSSRFANANAEFANAKCSRTHLSQTERTQSSRTQSLHSQS